MPDWEKVVKGIDICLQRFHCGEDCPYYDNCETGCMEQLREDALALLKAQKPVKSYIDYDNCDCLLCKDNEQKDYLKNCKYCENGVKRE